MTEPETDAARRQREADPFIIGLTQHALKTADTKRLADLIEGFLDSDHRAMRDAFILGLARSQIELTPTQCASALQRIRDQLDDGPPG